MRRVHVTSRHSRSAVPLCLVAALGLLTCGCPHLSLPPVEPNVSLYPTVFPVSVLDQCSAVDLPSASLRAIFEHTKWQEGLGPAGLSDTNADLILRGLRSRGYAELDSRRARGAIQWVALQVMSDGTALLATAGYARRPPDSQLLGIDLGTAPKESSRQDAYFYPLAVDTWEAMRGNVPMTVEHIVPLTKGREERWEIRHRIPLRDPEK